MCCAVVALQWQLTSRVAWKCDSPQWKLQLRFLKVKLQSSCLESNIIFKLFWKQLYNSSGGARASQSKGHGFESHWLFFSTFSFSKNKYDMLEQFPSIRVAT